MLTKNQNYLCQLDKVSICENCGQVILSIWEKRSNLYRMNHSIQEKVFCGDCNLMRIYHVS